MKKIKFILFAFTALLVVVLVGLKISAATTDFTMTADDYAEGTAYKNGTVLVDNELATIKVRKNFSVTKGFSPATSDDGKSLTFNTAFFTSGSSDSVAGSLLEVTSKAAGAKISVYYTISDGGFTTKDASKSGAMCVRDGASTELYKGTEASCKNTVAYYDEYTINNANETVYIGSTASRFVIFSFTLSQGQVAAEYEVTIYDGNEIFTVESVVSGRKLVYTPVKYGYNFAGYYLDAEFTDLYDTTTNTITGPITLYAKFNAWTVVPQKNELSAELVASIANVYHDLQINLPVENTIYTIMKGCQLQESNSIPCIGTSGQMSTATNNISFTVETSGIFTASMTTVGGSERSAQLLNENEEVVTCTSGNELWSKDEADQSVVKTVTWKLEAGTYYLGGTNGMRVFEAKFVEDAELHQYENADKTSIRYVCAIRNIAVEELANVVVTLKLTLEGANPANVNIPTVYTSVLGDNGFAAEANTYYMVYTITGLNLNEAYYGKTLTAQVVVTNGDTIVNSIVTTYTISNFTA